MALANCKKCGRLYNRINSEWCPSCLKEEDEMFFQVRDYLKEHRRATAYEVSEGTGIDLSIIYKFIREGRISTVDNPSLNFPCEMCGEPIQDGRFCNSCKSRLEKDLKQTKQELQQSGRERSKQEELYHTRKRNRD
jgi:flagellar operon protein (TIGR03826 family)